MSEEIEIKFALDPSHKDLIAQTSLIAGAKNKGTKRVVSAYYDTPTLQLRAEGIGFRVRKAGEAWLQTVKSEGKQVAGLSAREEHEVSLDQDHADLDKLKGTRFHKIIAPLSDQLGEIFVTDFHRTKWILELREDTKVEVVLDDGCIRSGDHSSPLLEVEMELLSGSRVPMVEAACELARSAPLRLETLSKAARGHKLNGHWFPISEPKPPQTQSQEEIMLYHLQCLQRGDTIARHNDQAAGEAIFQEAFTQMGRSVNKPLDSVWEPVAAEYKRLTQLVKDDLHGFLFSRDYCLFVLDILLRIQGAMARA